MRRQGKRREKKEKRLKDEAVKLGKMEAKAREGEEKRKDLKLKIAELEKTVKMDLRQWCI